MQPAADRGADQAAVEHERQLLNRLQTETVWKMRMRLLTELGECGSDLSVPFLSRALFDEKRLNNRVASIFALRDIGTPVARDALLRALPHQDGYGVNFTMYALRRQLTRDDIPFLARCLEEQRDRLEADGKLAILVALRRIPHDSVVTGLSAGTLYPLLDDNSRGAEVHRCHSCLARDTRMRSGTR